MHLVSRFRSTRSLRGFTLALGAASLTLALGGCATVYEGRYDAADGWRKGVVEEVGDAASLRAWAAKDCRKEFAAAEAAGRQFAVVRYRRFGERMRRIAPVPRGVSVSAGGAVFVQLGSCADGGLVKQTQAR